MIDRGNGKVIITTGLDIIIDNIVDFINHIEKSMRRKRAIDFSWILPIRRMSLVEIEDDIDIVASILAKEKNIDFKEAKEEVYKYTRRRIMEEK